LAVDEHPVEFIKGIESPHFILKSAALGPLPGTVSKRFPFPNRKLNSISILQPISLFRKIPRHHSDDNLTGKNKKGKEKQKDKEKGKGKKPITKMASLQPEDSPRKGGFFKAKVSDKVTETTLEKYGKVYSCKINLRRMRVDCDGSFSFRNLEEGAHL